jgi:hypothetical protein
LFGRKKVKNKKIVISIESLSRERRREKHMTNPISDKSLSLSFATKQNKKLGLTLLHRFFILLFFFFFFFFLISIVETGSIHSIIFIQTNNGC